ncbi:MAG: Dyp-type peroxidase [Lactobacillus sp.]|jgi:putative iron-dependent peroxidase|uniref:Dyp-type peroxidase n=1 Tax=Lacticaseibacillus suilingensis TaxID=2799577 RepID=A0ABW4BCT4_9LACO|nr:Dyp-type peroxidase [Lacticaseibacillus suilingensis]MCI1893810.1 Dyp-type peroxidase [Lactobacillus sp.]MCI1917826.1 Dyp-type peroxidase [Lactobacillus sp.]MCI1941683.1 Dyp-type peroxidase [Lactobacillus sp.]MCI1972229.1 Dyp-type peroxidase [Lactobacillus sp.]MCI2016901.1 Dyp-type peroxidase [Lactobacillus sp.]
MPIDLRNVQDVYKDAGDNIIFATMNLKRQDQAAELAAITDLAEHLPAFNNSMAIRYPDSGLAVAFGFSRQAWDYLFPTAQVPAELEEFAPIVGPKHTAPATPADLFFHLRARNSAVPYELLSEIMTIIGDTTETLDETHGFRYFEGRAIIGFVDGTENPSALDTPEYAVIGDEDPTFINGSYAFAQKYLHDMKAWDKLKVEQQEAAIGRKKFTDIELADEDKLKNAHNLASQDNEGGIEHKIVRMNVPFADAAKDVKGTYFIGYARHWSVTKRMLNNMFSQSDRLLDFSTPITGEVFFIPSKDTLAAIADEDLPQK